MRKQHHTWVFIIAVFIVLRVQALPALAEITKDIKIESIPEGAEVYSPEGTRNRLLGKTPFVYRAEFHSEMSVIRLILKKKPFRDAVIEVSAKQDQVMVTFQAQEYAMNPDLQNDLLLRRIQEKINPIINQAVPQFLETQQGAEFDLGKPVGVVAIDGGAVLLVDLFLAKMKKEIKGTGKEHYDRLSEALWEDIGSHLAIPLVEKIRSIPDITGIVLRVGFDEQRYLFSVKQRIEETIEWRCIPGTRIEYQNQCGMVWQQTGGYRYECKNVPVSVYDPCLNKVPQTKREMKLDPRTGVSKDQASVLYVLSTEAIRSDVSVKSLYDMLGILMTDSKGDQLKRSGSIPTILVPEKSKVISESNE
jgi:hypothetical protein